jgi:DnaJ-class molecular chaperone
MRTFGSLSDVFAAFFGETLFGRGGTPGHVPARGPDVGAQVEIDLADAVRGSRSA